MINSTIFEQTSTSTIFLLSTGSSTGFSIRKRRQVVTYFHTLAAQLLLFLETQHSFICLFYLTYLLFRFFAKNYLLLVLPDTEMNIFFEFYFLIIHIMKHLVFFFSYICISILSKIISSSEENFSFSNLHCKITRMSI